MKISLIGMSGAGKSFWSKKLKKNNFVRFCCDDIIENKLKKEIKNFDFSGTDSVSKWMGQPYEKKYFKTSLKYLQFEKEALGEIINEIENKLPKQTNVVIDTTGSLIHMDDKTLEYLCKLTKIVFLEVPENIKNEMYRFYLKDPKPVIWGKIFKKREKEEGINALMRCYPNLLKYRNKKYKKLADIILDYHILRKPQISIDRFLKMIK